MFIKSLNLVLALGTVLLGMSGMKSACAQIAGAQRSGLEVEAAIRAYHSDQFVGVGIRNFDGARQTVEQNVSATAPDNVAAYVVRVVNQGQSNTELRLHGAAVGEGWTVTYYDLNGQDITGAVTSPEGWSTPQLSALSAPENTYQIGIRVVADAPTARPTSEVRLYTTSGLGGTRPSAQYSDVVRAVTHLRDAHPPASAAFDASISGPCFRGQMGEGIHNRTGREQRALDATAAITDAVFSVRIENTSSQPCRYVVRCVTPPIKTHITMDGYDIYGSTRTMTNPMSGHYFYYNPVVGGADDPTMAAQVLGAGWTSPPLKPGERLELPLSLTLAASTTLGQIREAVLSVARSDALEDTDVVIAALGLQAVKLIQYSLDAGATWRNAPLAGKGFIRLHPDDYSTIGVRTIKAVPNLPWPASPDYLPIWDENGSYKNVGDIDWLRPQGKYGETYPYVLTASCGNHVKADFVIE